ncbi:threonine ammonia-lyase [Kineobactrum salinum]|uniref:Pyridoxal-phosphate dependent enzyme n=1 Tax=Kineobactrum salinum TaxID=2708301 RepID=A0A6C0U0E1_9GAMM|nr:pyridoxal-phosphate dependent enzyme [Kineobactrum salinum]QIB65049.1 pyridoxal-phosphate dependent enzyme [Kineobactrum salinum]
MFSTEALKLELIDFVEAQERIRDLSFRTPLIRLEIEGCPDTFLKLENLQPVGSFKVRCAANALIRRRDIAEGGVWTASAGNFAQGLAYAGRALGVAVTTYVPETAAASKIEALRRFGTKIITVPYADWWAILKESSDDPCFIHPVVDPDVLAGNGTIALEVLEDLPEVATVIAPYGGGGLSVGIASALKAAGSKARVVACETEAGAPLTAAFSAGKPVEVDFDPNTFITGMGGRNVLQQMWPLAKTYISGTALVSIEQVADAVRILVDHHHIVAEGAGAAAVAAAMLENRDGPTVCIVSGGHLDFDHLITILSGQTP